MYPQRHLRQLGLHKQRLRTGIARRRLACAGAAADLIRPLAWLDRLLALARKVEPFAMLAAVPLGMLLKRSPAARPRLLGTLLRWAPLLAGAARGVWVAGSRATRN